MPTHRPTDLPPLGALRAATSPEGVAPFRVGILIGRAVTLMNMVGIRTVVGLMTGTLLRGTASDAAVETIGELGGREIVEPCAGVVVHGTLYTAGPGLGSVEAALLIAAEAFGRDAAALAELVIEYEPHPPFGSGLARRAETLMASLAAPAR